MSIFPVAFLLLLLISVLVAGAIRPMRSGSLLGSTVTPWHRELLAKYSLYYGALDDAGKKRFERTVARLMHTKNWQGVGMELEDEARVMIAASAAQLLFGLPEVTLKNFGTIQVHPNAYRADGADRWHQGEVRPKSGVIKISWHHFLHGYANMYDAHNVALHEMAHALWFEDMIPNGEHAFLDQRKRAQWNAMAMTIMERIRMGQEVLFRSYAGTNKEEFFAVAVEYFFEQPREFRYEHPELYGLMAGLLRQDPLAKHSGSFSARQE